MKKKRNYWTKEKCQAEALKYDTRTKFKNNSRGAYESSRKNGWLDDVCYKHIPKKITFTKEKCKLLIEKCKNIKEFREKYSSAYQFCVRNNYNINLPKKYKPKNYWTFEKCEEVIKKCKTKKQFIKEYSTAYSKAIKKGWINKLYSKNEFEKVLMNREWIIYSYIFNNKFVYVGLTINEKTRKSNHLSNSKTSAVYKYIKENNIKEKDITYKKEKEKITRPKNAKKLEAEILSKYVDNGFIKINKHKTGNLGGGGFYWTKEKCINVAKKCKTKKEFRDKYSSAYGSVRKNNWLKYINSMFVIENPYMEMYLCRKESLKYKNKSTFLKYNHKAYMVALNNDWLKIFYIKKDYMKDALEEAHECKTKKEFREKYIKSYRYLYKHNLLDELNFTEIRKPNNYWSYEKCKEEILKYNTKRELRENNSTLNFIVTTNKWYELYFHMKEERKPNGYWTKEKCQEEATKYNNRTKFQNNCRGSYKESVKMKWLDEICSHMKEIKKPNGYWTKEKCQEEATKYNTKIDFLLNNGRAYNAAYSNKWLYDICEHMKKKTKNEY